MGICKSTIFTRPWQHSIFTKRQSLRRHSGSRFGLRASGGVYRRRRPYQQTYTTRAHVYSKTATDLKLDRIEQSDELKITLKSHSKIIIGPGELKAIHVIADCQGSGRVYVGSSIRGSSGREYYLLPGEYILKN